MSVVGEQIRKERLKRGWRQEDLAKRIGVSASAIGMYERGERKLDDESLTMFADIFEVSVDFLLGRTKVRNGNAKDNENIFYFDLDGLDEEGIEQIQEAIEFQRWRAQQKKQQKK